ncbi:MAG: family N-acetyltransferase [Acidobacteria bacterium]|nr:family N-acetyltransferase [Acidobacteriota bacterium]
MSSMPANKQSTGLRPVTPADQDFLFAVFASTRSEELSLSGWDDTQKQAFLAMQFNAQSRQYSMSYPDADSSIVLLEDLSVGRFLVDRSGKDIILVDIALLPEQCNGGIGTSLIQSLLIEAASAQKHVSLHVLRGSAAARLYERLGFTVVGDDGVYLEMKHGSLSA